VSFYMAVYRVRGVPPPLGDGRVLFLVLIYLGVGCVGLLSHKNKNKNKKKKEKRGYSETESLIRSWSLRSFQLDPITVFWVFLMPF
jgi:hypothetical protein